MRITMIIQTLIKKFKDRWNSEAGYRHLLSIAVPLICSTAAWSVQHFVDRMFLTWYSPSAIAASMPAGMLNFTIISLFLGTVSYVSTFSAQYFGAKKYNQIGPAIWQGIYISLIGGIVLLCIAPLSETIFHFIGHESNIQQDEIIYFKVLCMGSFPFLGASALSGFYSGRGKTWPIMWINIIGTAFNIVFDYFLIFGHGPFPEMGIKGAALATISSGMITFILYLLLLSQKKYSKKYYTFKGWRFNPSLFNRIIRFGLPNGVQFFIDIAGFSVFILIMGKLGTMKLAASNIAFNINTLAFMPMIGCGIAVSILVGQYIGQHKPEQAVKSAWSGFHITFAYMFSIAMLYLFVPSIFIKPFAQNAQAENFNQIKEIIRILLKFLAIFSIFDTLNIIFAFAIKGAGDTKYVMYRLGFVSLFVLVIPTYLAIIVFKQGIYVAWIIASVYVITLGFLFLRRFLKGNWKEMSVIEDHSHTIPPSFPEAPGHEVEIS